MPARLSVPSFLAAIAIGASAQAEPVRIHVFDCGHIAVSNMGEYAEDDIYEGIRGAFAVPCFLVRHPKGDLMWDTGVSDAVAATPSGVIRDIFTTTLAKPLVAQLAKLGVTPAEIEYLAVSHFHSDHTGNANLFAGSTWVVAPAERAWMFRDEVRTRATFRNYDKLEGTKTVQITEDHDLFGDGTVVILRTPGHTPGHLSLKVKLEETGTVILTGDVYHTEENRKHRRVPKHNADKNASVASMNRIEGIAEAEGARIIVQHDPETFRALPKSPAYLK